MSRKFDVCPFCGGALTAGYLVACGARGAHLYWKTNEKFEVEGMPKFLRKTFIGRWRDKWYLPTSTKDTDMASLCEACRIVVAALPVES